MTFYDVSVRGYNLIGSGSGMSTLTQAIEAFESVLTMDNWKNDENCGDCKLTGPYQEGSNVLWHDLLIRADIVLAVEKCGNFKWTDTYKLGKDTPREWLEKQASKQTDIWFEVSFSEI